MFSDIENDATVYISILTLFSACCSLLNNSSTRLWVIECKATKDLFSVMWSQTSV